MVQAEAGTESPSEHILLALRAWCGATCGQPALLPAAQAAVNQHHKNGEIMAWRRCNHGEGSIFQRSDGCWCAQLDLGWQNGQRARKCLYGATAQEVQEALLKARADKSQGLPIAVDHQTVAQYLERWRSSMCALSSGAGHYRNLLFGTYSKAHRTDRPLPSNRLPEVIRRLARLPPLLF